MKLLKRTLILLACLASLCLAVFYFFPRWADHVLGTVTALPGAGTPATTRPADPDDLPDPPPTPEDDEHRLARLLSGPRPGAASLPPAAAAPAARPAERIVPVAVAAPLPAVALGKEPHAVPVALRPAPRLRPSPDLPPLAADTVMPLPAAVQLTAPPPVRLASPAPARLPADWVASRTPGSADRPALSSDPTLDQAHPIAIAVEPAPRSDPAAVPRAAANAATPGPDRPAVTPPRDLPADDDAPISAPSRPAAVTLPTGK